MATLAQTGLGKGVYSVAEAARLTRIPNRRIYRWARGYSYRREDGPAFSPSVFAPDYTEINGVVQLSFLDMIEIRFVDGFRKLGVSWPEIRRAANAAAQLLSTTHPFATYEFLTDGHHLFADIQGELEDERLIHLARKQQVFRSFVRPHLHGIEFDDGIARRWWPLGKNRKVLVDPDRAFGTPITSQSGVATSVIAAFCETQPLSEAIRWFEVSAAEVRDAIRFEDSLAA